MTKLFSFVVEEIDIITLLTLQYFSSPFQKPQLIPIGQLQNKTCKYVLIHLNYLV